MLHCPKCGHKWDASRPSTPAKGRVSLSRYVSLRQEATPTPSRAVRSCTTGLPSRGPLHQLRQQQHQQQHMPTQPARRTGAAGTPVDSFYRSLRQEEAALDLDRLHVLKIRNREAEGGVMTKDKFSKYSPLPDISKPHGRPLLRQKTYDVLEPVYVKGPPPPPPPKTAATAKDKPPPRTAERSRTAATVKTAKEPPRRQKLPHIAPAQAAVPAPPPSTASVKKPPVRRPVQFRPQELSKDILPHSPTAFWFPI